jgi:threonylcarbamoyladenosine tRNA methylthiotransferase MtaB
VLPRQAFTIWLISDIRGQRKFPAKSEYFSAMKTFCIQTLGCKVNQYETEQVAALLRSRGLVPAQAADADLRIVNTCSVTVQAASQSRQSVRQMVRRNSGKHPSLSNLTSLPTQPGTSNRWPTRARVVVIGCWATSDKAEAAAMEGVDAVLTHQDDLAAELERLLALWQTQSLRHASYACAASACANAAPTRSTNKDGWILKAGTAPDNRTDLNKSESVENVNEVPIENALSLAVAAKPRPLVGATTLPILGDHQTGRQRAFLKVQDGCDAHCTYCIIPRLRPTLWSKPIEDAVEEAKRLVDSGHIELVLTGIFLGAYGQPTALRRRQGGAKTPPLARLVDSLCRNIPGLKRLRLSSLEPGDLSEELLATLCAHKQVVPHFHLPLQSGSDLMLRRMNRQYTRCDFLNLIDRVNAAFDRPALTTDIIVAFPGETDGEFGRTLEVVEQARFIHIHAFPYSPRPGTAAARWTDQFVRGPVVNDRIEQLRRCAQDFSVEYRSRFLGETVEVIAARDRENYAGGTSFPPLPWGEGRSEGELKAPLLRPSPLPSPQGRGGKPDAPSALRTGRCERYFAVHFEAPHASPGDLVRVRISRVTATRTFGEVVR